MKLAILSSSVRLGRNSHRVALYFETYIRANNIASIDMIDLQAYNFPVFEERLQYHPDPSEQMTEFASRIDGADGVIIVTPEYNGGYPASLKNAIDLLYEEWRRKPIAIATVSAGPFAGAQVTTSLVFSLWKIGAWVVPAMFPVPAVQKAFDEQGKAFEAERTDKRAKTFLEELAWCVEAKLRMQQ